MNKSAIKISFIIPAFNAEKTITRAVESIAVNSRRTDFEIIVVENGSKDHTAELVKSLEKTYDSLTLIQSDKGVSKARNAGLKRAQGTWIVFLDADDFLEKNAVDILLKDAETAEADLWCYGHKAGRRKVPVADNKVGHVYEGSEIEICRIKMLENPTRFMQAWGKMFQYSIIADNQILFDEDMKLSEDSDFTLRYTRYCNTIHLSGDIIYHYSLDNVSTMRLYDKTKSLQYIKALEISSVHVEEESLSVKAAFYKYILVHMNIVMVREIFRRENPADFKGKAKQMIQLYQEPVFSGALRRTPLGECLTVRLLPSFFIKLHLDLLASILFSVRAIQNYRREKMES